MPRVSDLVGQRFGRLVVQDLAEKRDARGLLMWRCVCDCGGAKNVRTATLNNGSTRSCGCFARERASAVNTTHGLSKTRVFTVWNAMCQRCTNPAARGWYKYGGRGIAVCRRWRGPGSFERFIQDVGMPPSDQHSIERKRNNGNYTPKNCCWATRSQQARNKRNNRYVTYRGRRRLLVEWATEVRIPYKELHRRIVSRGWPVHRAFTTPVKKAA